MPLRAFNWSIQAPPLQQTLLLLHQSAPGKYSSGSIAVYLASTQDGKQACKIIESLRTEYMAYKMNTDKNTERNMFCNYTGHLCIFALQLSPVCEAESSSIPILKEKQTLDPSADQREMQEKVGHER